MSQISIWSLRKTELSTWWQDPCWQSQRSDVSCSCHQVCTHLRRDSVPHRFADPLQVIKVSRLMIDNSTLQLSPQIFYGNNVWRLTRPLQDLNVLLLEPLSHHPSCCHGRVFWVIVMLEYPSTTHFQCPGFNALALTVHGPSIVPLMRCSCPVPLAEVSTSMFDGGDGVPWGLGQHSSSSKTQASWVDAKELDFGLIWPPQFHPVLLWIIDFRRACTCAFLSWGILRVLQDFSPLRRNVTDCFLGDYGHNCLECFWKFLIAFIYIQKNI